MTLDDENAAQSIFAFDGLAATMFAAAAEGLILVDTRGCIVALNPRAQELLGYAEAELLGKPVETLVPSRFGERHVKHRESYKHAEGKRPMGIGMDLTARRKDGSEFPIEISLNKFFVGDNEFVMALMSDVTRRKVAEQSLAQLNEELERRVMERTRDLAESQLLYEVIARNFPNGAIMVFDQDFNYVFAEGRELFRMGVTSQELVGSNYLERLSPAAREVIEPQLIRAFHGHNVSFDLELNGKYYELQVVPLRDHDGAVTRLLVVEMNVTSQKRAEQNILEALEKERQLNELKSRFVSMASHEFRTPLSTILTSLSLAARYHGPGQEAQLQKHYSRIKSSVHNLTGILNDFLSLDKLESGLVAANPSDTNLRTLLDDLVDELQTICKEGQAISVDYEGEHELFCDQHMLRNVLVNLISNASKYSGEGKPILIRVRVADGKVEVAVRDHGIGIPEGDQRHMFERFFRAHNATNIQGTGLGLNIVKKYVTLLGGDIWFESKLQEGSTFTVIIPQHQVHEKDSAH